MESLFTCHICPGHLTYPSKLPGTVLGNSEIGPLDIQSYLPAFSLFFSHTILSLTVFLLYFLSRSLFDRFLITYPFPLTLVMLLLHILTSIFKHFILLHISWSFFTNYLYFFERLLSCQKFMLLLLLFRSFSQCQSLFQSLFYSEKSSSVSHTSFSKGFLILKVISLIFLMVSLRSAQNTDEWMSENLHWKYNLLQWIFSGL